ncbi:MAG: SDR family NAD(P)-dependent oxidoreductase [Rhizomicrobium sp.]
MTKTFGAQSTTDEVLEGVNLSGKRVLVTGASAGLGVETCRTLAAHGATVIGAGARSRQGRTRLPRPYATVRHMAGSLELIELDLASLKSVRACADALVRAGKPFDVGDLQRRRPWRAPRGITAEGFETQFGTNHLGHFVFVNRIASLIKKNGGRLVNLSSAGHRFSDVNIDDPNFEHTPYTEFRRLWPLQDREHSVRGGRFDRRHKNEGVRATAVHPGGIQTELGRYMTPELIQGMLKSIEDANKASGAPPFQWKTIPQGAATTVWSGLRRVRDEAGGKYCEDCHVATLQENPDARNGVRSYALNADHAKALWTKSEEMVGETFASA